MRTCLNCRRPQHGRLAWNTCWLCQTYINPCEPTHFTSVEITTPPRESAPLLRHAIFFVHRVCLQTHQRIAREGDRTDLSVIVEKE